MKRKIPYYQCLMVIILISVSLVINILFLKRPVYIGLIIGIIAAFIVSIINGYKFSEVLKMMYIGLSRNFLILFILSMIGMLIGIWKIGGIIPTMLYYSFGIINKKIFLFSSFIISSIISLLMGTSSGTVSTIGIVLIGLGNTMGFSPQAIAGAVVSGAFLGDRSSPISGVLNIISSLTETKTYENFKYFWSTMSIGVILASVFYIIIGLLSKGHSAALDTTQYYKQLLIQLFNISPWLLLPPILLISFSVFRIPTVYALLMTVVVSGVFSTLFQKLSFIEIFKASIFGYNPSIPAQYSTVLVGGGLISLKTMLIVLMFATSLNGIFEGTEMITTIIYPFFKKISNSRDLQLFTIVLSIGSAIFICNQLMSVIIPSGVLKGRYKEMDIENRVFARLLSDSGVMASSLIPWNVAALTPAVIMGVSVLDFIPYAFLGYVMPIIAVINVFLSTKKTNNILLEENL